ncbi:MAG TPA: flagellar hook-basal body complex protein FliE [Gemmatirosa sp.]
MSDAISAITSRMRSHLAVGNGIAGGLGLDTGSTIRVPVGAPKDAGGTSFGDTLKQFVSGVSDQQDAAGELKDRFLRGEPVELHQVMAAGEEASLSLEMMVELRNKVLDAYKTLTAMQS